MRQLFVGRSLRLRHSALSDLLFGACRDSETEELHFVRQMVEGALLVVTKCVMCFVKKTNN